MGEGENGLTKGEEKDEQMKEEEVFGLTKEDGQTKERGKWTDEGRERE